MMPAERAVAGAWPGPSAETHFHRPGRYAMWREAGTLRLCLSVEGPRGPVMHHRFLPPRLGYLFLMNRRRTELLYAIATAMAAGDALDAPAFDRLVETAAEAPESGLAALADRWDRAGQVSAALAALLGAPPACGPEGRPRWFARPRRGASSGLPAGPRPG
jgi:hypothetical protein